MATKTTKTPSAVELAPQNLAEGRTTVTLLTEGLAKLEQEHQQIEVQIEYGSFVADVDPKAKLKELIGRRTTRPKT